MNDRWSSIATAKAAECRSVIIRRRQHTFLFVGHFRVDFFSAELHHKDLFSTTITTTVTTSQVHVHQWSNRTVRTNLSFSLYHSMSKTLITINRSPQHRRARFSPVKWRPQKGQLRNKQRLKRLCAVNRSPEATPTRPLWPDRTEEGARKPPAVSLRFGLFLQLTFPSEFASEFTKVVAVRRRIQLEAGGKGRSHRLEFCVNVHNEGFRGLSTPLHSRKWVSEWQNLPLYVSRVTKVCHSFRSQRWMLYSTFLSGTIS